MIAASSCGSGTKSIPVITAVPPNDLRRPRTSRIRLRRADIMSDNSSACFIACRRRLPPPLAGEGWEGPLAASSVPWNWPPPHPPPPPRGGEDHPAPRNSHRDLPHVLHPPLLH